MSNSLLQLNEPWALSLTSSREVVQGIAAIRQQIWIALGTSKGSDPLRPFFGTDIYKMVDMPPGIASPNIKKEIIDSIALWVPAVKITSIKDIFFTPQSSGTQNFGIRFEITYTIDNLSDVVFFSMSDGNISWDGLQTTVLTDIIPTTTNRINIILVAGSIYATGAPVEGFANGTELFNWVVANWLQYGTWAIYQDRIILYLIAGIIGGSLDVYEMTGGDFNDDFNDDFNI